MKIMIRGYFKKRFSFTIHIVTLIRRIFRFGRKTKIHLFYGWTDERADKLTNGQKGTYDVFVLMTRKC